MHWKRLNEFGRQSDVDMNALLKRVKLHSKRRQPRQPILTRLTRFECNVTSFGMQLTRFECKVIEM